jgi:undecaprenyl diphosphate synthase
MFMNSASDTASEAQRLHVAIIMDGNGRWATQRGLPRAEGHRRGRDCIRQVVHAAPSLGVTTLSLYAFSGNNWGRPQAEVLGLMRLFEEFFWVEKDEWQRQGIRVSVIGRRDRLPASLLAAIEASEAATGLEARFRLRFAIDYSGQEVIMEAARHFRDEPSRTRDVFARLMALASHATPDDAQVDLLIRTGGEQRLSDFLLWELAYAELWFTGKLWPDFSAADLSTAVRGFQSRERRYGRLAPTRRDGPSHINIRAERVMPVGVFPATTIRRPFK